MPNTRQQILDNLALRLLQIVPGAVIDLPGDSYTCSNQVHQVKAWRKTPYSVAELPAIAYRDSLTRITTPEYNGPSRYSLRVILAAYTAGTTPASVGRSLLADMLAAVWSDPKCGGLARRTDVMRASLALVQRADIVAGSRLSMDIVYTSAEEIVIPPGENILTADGEALTSDGEALTW